jgi:tetratricopeptide (TPR) repeat protein
VIPLEPVISKFFVSFSTKMLVAAVKHLWEQGKKDSATGLEKVLKDHDASRSMSTRIDQRLLVSLQSLRASTDLLDALRLWVADDLLCDAIAQLFAGGKLSSATLTGMLASRSESIHVNIAEISAVCALWVDAIYLSIGEVPELSHALQLQNERRIEGKIDAQRLEVQEVGAMLSEQMHPILISLTTDVQKIQSTLTQWPRPYVEPAIVTPQALQSRFQQRFTNHREKLIHGSVRDAQSSFAELIEDLKAAGSSAESDLLFKSLLNYSSALIELERYEEAKTALDEAQTLAPNDLRLKRHTAILLMHTGDTEGALKIVRALRVMEPEDDKHLFHEAALLSSEAHHHELMNLLQSNPRDSAEYYCALSDAFLRRKNYEDASVAARKACAIDPENELSWMALAYSIGFKVVEHRQTEAASAVSPPSHEIDQLREAVEAAEKAVNILRKRERFRVLTDVLVNTMAFLAAMNEEAKALMIGRELWATDHRSRVMLQNLFILYMRNQLHDEALQVAEAMAIADFSEEEASLRRSQALVGLGRHEIVLADWERRRNTLTSDITKEEWVEVVACAFCMAHQSERALALLDEMLVKQPRSENLHLRRARVT